MTAPEEIYDRRAAYDDDAENVRADYPGAIRTIVTAVRDLAATERKVEELLAEIADRESERADLRDRVTKYEAIVARVVALKDGADPAFGGVTLADLDAALKGDA